MEEHDGRKYEISRKMMELEFHPSSKIETWHQEECTKLPLVELTALGGSLASMLEPFRTITQTIDVGAGEGIYRAVFPDGVTGKLAKFRNEDAFLGTIMNNSGIAGQARFNPIDSIPTGVTTTVPFDPATLAMAIALAEISKKLDDIQETQREMFEFLELKEKSQLKGDLNILADILNNYKYNWDNEKYKTNKHMQVLDIKRSSEQSIIFSRDRVARKLDKKSLIQLDKDVKNKLNEVRDMLKDYQLALYLFAFASFLDVMLLENYDSDYLDGITAKIEDYSHRYLELYTTCFDMIEKDANTSLQSHLLGGLSAAGKAVGGAVSKTPIGSKTRIDEKLAVSGERLSEHRTKRVEQSMDRLVEAKGNNVRPFVENIKAVNKLYNQPMELLVDSEGVFVRQLEA